MEFDDDKKCIPGNLARCELSRNVKYVGQSVICILQILFFEGFTQWAFFSPWSDKIICNSQLINELVKKSADPPSVDWSTI